MMFGRGRQNELDFNRMWGDLSLYNTEVARGIVHTLEWDAKMREKQVAYNEWIARQPRSGRFRIARWVA